MTEVGEASAGGDVVANWTPEAFKLAANSALTVTLRIVSFKYTADFFFGLDLFTEVAHRSGLSRQVDLGVRFLALSSILISIRHMIVIFYVVDDCC